MKLLSVMKRIKELDHEVAAVQKVDIDYDKLRFLFRTTKKQSNFMILFLDKCEKEEMGLQDSQFLLEGYMLNEIKAGDYVYDTISKDEGTVEEIILVHDALYATMGDKDYLLDDIELKERA